MQHRRLKLNVNGLLLIDKPLGFSSNQALSKIKWLFSPIKAGHTGTLDPMATGLLPICLGEATKFSSFLLDADKTYEAVIKLGYSSSTGDSEGKLTQYNNIELPTLFLIKKILNMFIGETKQLPPMYSALKHKGQALYTLARKGIEVKREKRIIQISSINLLGYDKDLVRIEVRCSKGTYIRTLAGDIGDKLKVGGYLLKLRRTEIGRLTINNAISLVALEKIKPENRVSLLQPPQTLLEGYKAIQLTLEEEVSIKDGQPVLVNSAVTGYFSLYNEQNIFIGVGEVCSNKLLKAKRLMSLKV
jgi:tRNA pseudouridine55 synthase